MSFSNMIATSSGKPLYLRGHLAAVEECPGEHTVGFAVPEAAQQRVVDRIAGVLVKADGVCASAGLVGVTGAVGVAGGGSLPRGIVRVI